MQTLKTNKKSIKRSLEWLERAKKVIPSCTQTFSKGPSQFVQGVAPIYLDRGLGSHVFDVDGNEYIDYAVALGPVILGYCYPRINQAIIRQLEKGITFTQMHPLEVEVAELIVKYNPSAEMVRFGKNGSDATTGAIRAARAFTGREKIACGGYHGWHDWFIASTTRNLGVPEFNKGLIHTFSYNNLEQLEKIFSENKNQIAAVILEPSTFEEPKDNFLQKVKDLAHKNGALLIFDEVVTGFKIGMSGVQGYYKVIPDLTCLGKALANGMPLSAVAGSRDIMKIFDKVFYSFTFGGEALSLVAAQETILELSEKKVHDYLWKMGQILKDGYNQLAKKKGLEGITECKGLAPRTLITWKDQGPELDALSLKSLFQQECIKGGVLFTGVQHMTFSHTQEDIQKTLAVFEDAMEVMKNALRNGSAEKYLEGKRVEAIFRKLE